MPDISQEKLEAFHKDLQALCDTHDVDLTIQQRPEILVKQREKKEAPPEAPAEAPEHAA